MTIDLNAGALAPVTDEVDAVDLRMTGAIPRDLNGVLVRNGPNPLRGRFDGGGVLSWWPEDAMLHAITFGDGRATRYRNRWARTQRWARVYDPARAVARRHESERQRARPRGRDPRARRRRRAARDHGRARQHRRGAIRASRAGWPRIRKSIRKRAS